MFSENPLTRSKPGPVKDPSDNPTLSELVDKIPPAAKESSVSLAPWDIAPVARLSGVSYLKAWMESHFPTAEGSAPLSFADVVLTFGGTIQPEPIRHVLAAATKEWNKHDLPPSFPNYYVFSYTYGATHIHIPPDFGKPTSFFNSPNYFKKGVYIFAVTESGRGTGTLKLGLVKKDDKMLIPIPMQPGDIVYVPENIRLAFDSTGERSVHFLLIWKKSFPAADP